MISSSAFAGWRILYIPEHKTNNYFSPERVRIGYREEDSGYKTLAEVLTKIKAEGKIDQLDCIFPYSYTKSSEFQKELTAGFEELAPKDWAEAKNSAGNMHNPKITALRKHLSKAFMQTSLAKEITRDLKPYGLVITEFGVEKLSYEQDNGKRMISGIFHISIAPKQEAEQVGADQPATAPQLKSEGDMNTNPQSEVRPR